MRHLSSVLSIILTISLTIILVSSRTDMISAVTNPTFEETILYKGSAIGERWKVATSTYTTNSHGNFNPYLISEEGYFYVEYTGKKGNIALVLVETASATWGSVKPAKSGKAKKGYYSIFRYKDCVSAYGSDDFSSLDVIHVSGGATAVTVKTLKWYGRPLADDLGAAEVIWQGSFTADKANHQLTHFYTVHAGGSFDAASVNRESYLYAEYTGTADAVYLAFASSSGGRRWAVVNASETGTTSSGLYYSKFDYAAFTKIYGTDFKKLDHIFVYSSKDSEITLQRMAYFVGEGTPADTGDGSWDRPTEGIAFIGDSIIENPLLLYGDWNTLLGRTDCVNWGIGGQTTSHLAARMGDLLKCSYDKIVILCGTNDIGYWMKLTETMDNYRSVFDRIGEAGGINRVYVISILPLPPSGKKEAQKSIRDINKALKKLSAEYDFVTFVDCYSDFLDPDGNSIGAYYADTVHPNEAGYQVIAKVLNPYLQGN